MKLDKIHIRDPFVLVESGTYYLYGTRGSECRGKCTGLDVYTSKNLRDWSDATEVFTPPEGFWADENFWAPEVHKYRDAYWMLASFKSADRCRGTQILRSKTPMGPFIPISDGPVTPPEWECLDGTLYFDAHCRPYLVFCHEWLQVKDGEMCVIQLKDDLSDSNGEAKVLFHASEPVWASKDRENYITDGPFLYEASNGELLMIWSSIGKHGYCEAIARSKDGIMGPWVHDEELLFSRDGGHGMLFRTIEGTLKFICHQPNKYPFERPCIVDIIERDGQLSIRG